MRDVLRVSPNDKGMHGGKESIQLSREFHCHKWMSQVEYFLLEVVYRGRVEGPQVQYPRIIQK